MVGVMQEGYGMAGVRFWMSWLALIVAAMVVRPHRSGLAEVGLLSVVWAAFAIRFVVRKVNARSDLTDIDFMLCVVALALTAAGPLILAPFWLHLRHPEMMMILVGYLLGGLARITLRRRRV
jgi:hypothetical protein